MLTPFINAENPNFNTIWIHWLFGFGNWVIALTLAGFLLLRVRKINKNYILNKDKGNVYYDMPYLWFWFCSKILAYKKCNLIRIPIPMQFKLLINDTFDEWLTGEFPLKTNCRIDVQYYNEENNHLETLNLIVHDTYPLNLSQIPKGQEKNYTLFVYRENPSKNREYCQDLIDKINSEIKNLPINIKRVNCFLSTNPAHNEKIACDIFKDGDRGNIKTLYAYKQEQSGARLFKESGLKIYDYR